VDQTQWFENEDNDELDEVQDAFVHRLRERAAAWPLSPIHSILLLADYEAFGYPLGAGDNAHAKALVYLDVPDETANVSLLTVGAYLDGERVRGDKLHNQLLTLPDEPSNLAFDATGSPKHLADRTAEWFEALLRRPIVRYEWLRAGEVYAKRWLFADCGQPLVEVRIRTNDLGPPDRIIHVRGDRA
jgi:hypothetical protein